MNEIKQNSPYAWFLAARPKTLTGAIIGIVWAVPCLQRRTVQDRTRLLCRPLCLRHADCRQLYQRPLRLPERDRPSGRPAGAAARLRRRLDYAGSHENRHRHRTDTVVPGRLAVLFTVWGSCPTEAGNWWCWAWCAYCLLSSIPRCSPIGLGRRTGAGVLRLRAVCGTYYVQAYTLNMDVVVLSLVSGLAIDTLLMVNNYRDREQDAVSGKCTLVVRYGKKFGENMYLALGIAAVLLCFWFVYTGKLTPLEFIWAPCVYLYMHALTWRKMIQIGSGKKLNSILGETSRNMLFLGLLLAVALN